MAAPAHPGAARVPIRARPLLSSVTSVHFLDLSVLRTPSAQCGWEKQPLRRAAPKTERVRTCAAPETGPSTWRTRCVHFCDDPSLTGEQHGPHAVTGGPGAGARPPRFQPQPRRSRATWPGANRLPPLSPSLLPRNTG